LVVGGLVGAVVNSVYKNTTDFTPNYNFVKSTPLRCIFVVYVVWSTSALVVPPTRRMTIGDRAFPVAVARVWNALPSFVTDSATVATFRHHLKTYLFARSLS